MPAPSYPLPTRCHNGHIKRPQMTNDDRAQMIMTVIITSFYWCLCPDDDDESGPGPRSEDQTLSPGPRLVLGQALRAASARAKGGCGGERGRGATLFSWVSILGASGGCSDGSIMLELTFSDESDYDVRPRSLLMWPLALFELLPAS